ncbi:MAG: EpsI family protein [Aquabacterium sp.]|uniref:exosortase-associated protein EpsI, B-type n=1 Tax=Aquabacterium sp. TaxID=1872578 RepID=UPI0025C3CC6E|nr:exosortase-associated protein EpsI, B-type [Aquabacterium sp.]MBI5926410.1 EpsI family protein [Aquabacterium sp.]
MALAFEQPRKNLPAAIIVAACLMLGGLLASEWMKPRRVMADELAPIVLPQLIPVRFGDWRLDESGPPVVFDPTVEATLKQVYSQTLNRTYVNAKGQVIMLALAYGKNQNSWSTAAHRPEFCYRAQGFVVTERGAAKVQLDDHQITAMHLVADRSGLVEPISYWVTLHDTTALPGASRKLQQIRFGLQGMIVDGFLVRMSSFGANEAEQFKLQESFARDLEKAVPANMRPRLFGNK